MLFSFEAKLIIKNQNITDEIGWLNNWQQNAWVNAFLDKCKDWKWPTYP